MGFRRSFGGGVHQELLDKSAFRRQTKDTPHLDGLCGLSPPCLCISIPNHGPPNELPLQFRCLYLRSRKMGALKGGNDG